MTTPSHVPPVLPTVQPAPAPQVDSDTVETAKKLHTLKTRSANFGRNVLKPAALGLLGGAAYALVTRKSKDTESSENFDDTVTDTTE